ncbi:signal transduction histidine kinase [Bradyrhizobium sp. USDA 4354]
MRGSTRKHVRPRLVRLWHCRGIRRAASRAIVDKIQIQKVALDLIRNAIEAMASCPRREVAVNRFTVADKGPGISADIGDRLFQPFVTTERHGNGRGLSICRTIIESHGGHIVAQANPGGSAIL